MIGAILGDIAGSTYEFDNIKTKDFVLFKPHKLHNRPCCFTDDTVLTCAVADALINNKNISTTLRTWARRFPNAGFGGMFFNWAMFSNKNKPYNSCGNGSAMRTSPVAYIAKNEKEVIKLATKVSSVTHNHPEGIKGAVVTSMCVFKALHGASREEIKEYAISEYPEIASLDYEELKKTYYHGAEICQITVPQAIYCFLISKDFDDCLKTVISIGGDCDTTGAIAGAIAEAFYGIPAYFLDVLDNFFKTKEEQELLEPVLRIYAKKMPAKMIKLFNNSK